MVRWIRMAALATTLGATALGVSAGPWAQGAEAQRRGGAASAERAETEQAANTPSGVVNINTATEEELTRLPGIGESKARAILALRERVRRFRQVEDVMRVRGIGRATFRKLRPMLAVEGPTTLGAAGGAR